MVPLDVRVEDQSSTPSVIRVGWTVCSAVLAGLVSLSGVDPEFSRHGLVPSRALTVIHLFHEVFRLQAASFLPTMYVNQRRPAAVMLSAEHGHTSFLNCSTESIRRAFRSGVVTFSSDHCWPVRTMSSSRLRESWVLRSRRPPASTPLSRMVSRASSFEARHGVGPEGFHRFHPDHSS